MLVWQTARNEADRVRNSYKTSDPFRLCELMGTSYRHLLRTLREFCENGYLVRENGGYLIADEEALKRLAGSIRYD